MSTDDNLDILDATLCFVAMYGIPVPDKEYDVFCKGFMHTKGYKEAKASIKAESLRIALEILPKKKEIPEIDGAEIVVGTGVARGYNQAIDDAIKAFEDRYGDTK